MERHTHRKRDDFTKKAKIFKEKKQVIRRNDMRKEEEKRVCPKMMISKSIVICKYDLNKKWKIDQKVA